MIWVGGNSFKASFHEETEISFDEIYQRINTPVVVQWWPVDWQLWDERL